MISPRLTVLCRVATVAVMGLAVTACSMGGGGGGGAGLSAGLTQSMASSGAQLNRGEALGIINQYRASVGARPVADDPQLDATAQSLAAAYAKSGASPKKPAGAIAMRSSAGYYNFAETFSGWRNNPADASALTTASATRAGIAAVYDANSGYGVYWVLVLG